MPGHAHVRDDAQARSKRGDEKCRLGGYADVARHGQAGWDYVLIGHKATTATVPFDQLCDNLRDAVTSLGDAKT